MKMHLYILGLLAIVGCDFGAEENPTSPRNGLFIARVSGNNQMGEADTFLPDPFVVLVTDHTGQPVSNQRLDFEVIEGRGNLTVESAISDTKGQASTWLKMGDQADTVVVQANVFGHESAIRFTATLVDAGDAIRLDLPVERLVAHYPFSGDAHDESQNDHHGSVHGPVLTTDRWSHNDSAYEFSRGDHIDLGDNPVFDITGAITLSAWIKPDEDALGGIVHYVSKRRFPSGAGYILSMTDGTPRFFVGNGLDGQGEGNIPAIANITLSANRWYHIVGVWNGMDTNAIFVDGVKRGENAVTRLSSSPTKLFIGSDADGGFPFTGCIDDIRIYDRDLSEGEIVALFQEGGWTGRVDGGPSDIDHTPPAVGGPVNVLSLDGADDWVRVPVLDSDNALAYPGSGGWSLEVWAKPAKSQSVAVLCGQASTNDSPKDPYYLEIGNGTRSGTGGGSFKVQDNAGRVTWTGDMPAVATVGEWIHFAGTFEEGAGRNILRFYVNGALKRQSETSITIGRRFSEFDPFAIGALASFGGESGFVPFAGEIDEVRVWNRTISQDEIQDRMRSELTGSEEGLVGYWNFNGLNADGHVPDLTDSGNHGVLLFDAHLARSEDAPIP